MNQNKTVSGTALLKCKLLVTVVDHRKEDFFMDYIQAHGANLQMTMRGEGTAKSEMLRMLGLAESEKTVLFSVIREDQIRSVCDGLAEKFKTVKNGQGIAFTIPLSSVVGASIYRFLSDQKTGGTVS
ncbi:MAG: hypothetical protein E7604_02435 [Ruminococcaceae bacterium]|nr:hypothetical protein [Oscillospiraceae bacterium]